MLLLTGLGSSVLAQEGFPITLDQGPLICFSKAAEGEPQCVDLYVANCSGEQQGTRFWRNTGNTKVVARLDQSHLLLASYSEPYALIVVDTLTGKHRVLAEGSPHDFVAVHNADVLYLGDNRWDNLEIGVSPLSSSTPTVKVGWFDNEHVVSSETRGSGRGFGSSSGSGNFTFNRRSIETGKITDDASYGPLALCHRVPPLPGAANAPVLVFQIQTEGDEYLLMQKGKNDPIQAVPKDYRSGAKIQLAKDSTFAIARLAHTPQLVQLYPPIKPPLALSSTGGMDWQWLPAAVDVESSK
ncbi:MAG: hypothetical protein ACI85K_001577 [Hyphomicrobiaceae bacterium]|jgi:hypothetical protein